MEIEEESGAGLRTMVGGCVPCSYNTNTVGGLLTLYRTVSLGSIRFTYYIIESPNYVESRGRWNDVHVARWS